ncbi:MAG TPA: 30S ribosomal protein S12 methylthiotransferase RimO [Candidatus Avimonoglobus intestinipullorum]|uniref:Ribosomal protein uS12 methylthiotransferase RimO n=1 Tax=Candidatus Avimonoglobus intestinipullorum TaxID=2840699 RepID=A0A9D1S6Z7_9FIRM|nr:30S ribosomal protein S12 methylthiotransferase RimO [Candidatus Avimonoglobus intestinipullorum]
MGYNIGMVSLGCAKNQTDSETMLGILAERGHRLVADPKAADVIVVNTCGFIESAKQESIDTLLEMAQYKDGRCKILIAAGCLAERYHDEILQELPEVDAVVGTGDYDKIAEVVEQALGGARPLLYGNMDRTPEEGLPRVLTTPAYTAYLKIADGCDNRCTYCAIPMIRGRFRSRRIEDIVAEARELAAAGVKELILIAQDTTRYGADLYGEYALDRLLEELCTVEGIYWIRVHYYYTEAVTERLIDVMAAHEQICNYVDMPIQHINDTILRRMARRTNRAEIEEKIRMIREKMPDVTIRTSLIVGFPGETEEQFEELYQFAKDVRFDRLGAFAYSQEEGTPAAAFEGQVAEDVKAARLEQLMALQQEISRARNQEKIGTELEVLVEGYDAENYLYFGRSRGDSIGVDSTVYFAARDEVEIGSFVRVRILDADAYDLTGEQL